MTHFIISPTLVVLEHTVNWSNCRSPLIYEKKERHSIFTEFPPTVKQGFFVKFPPIVSFFDISRVG